MTTAIRRWLRLEGLAILAVAATLYGMSGSGWMLFAVLFFAPDLAMLGYLGGPRVGALAYNLVHTYVAPAVVAAAGWALAMPSLLAGALIWVAHIGFDRALGYGLKLPSDFRATHLGRIGRDA